MWSTTEKIINNNLIENIEYFSCGYCTNKLNNIFSGIKKTKKNKVIFEAGVFLIKHKTEGYILYDTGYNIRILKNKFKYFLYRALNPITLKEKNMINFQLKNKGIDVSEIKYVILSHLHPDHIGGLEFFPNAKIILTEACFKEYKKNALRSLIFKEFLPKNFEDNIIKINPQNENIYFKYQKSYDLFSDKSIILTELNGHSKGQCCAFFPEKNLFIAADSSWRTEFLDRIDKMKFLPRLIQNNFSEYKKSIEILKKIRDNSINIVVSHDPSLRIWRILNEKNN